MSYRLHRGMDKATFRTGLVRLASFLILAAAGIWLAACSGAADRGPAASSPLTPVPYATPPGREATAPASPAQGARSGSSPAAATDGNVEPNTLTVTDKGQGGVTVRATWVTPGSKEAAASELDRYLAFSVALDTHSGDLTQYNLTKLSVLRDNQGKEIPPAAWQVISDDSHHREGILKFPKGAGQGSKYLELVVRDVGGVKERVLRWDLGR